MTQVLNCVDVNMALSGGASKIGSSCRREAVFVYSISLYRQQRQAFARPARQTSSARADLLTMISLLLWLFGTGILLYMLRLIFIPQPIPGLPYSRMSYLMPWGDLLNLGISFFARGEVFAWFNSQSHHHRSPIYQAFIPSFSTSFPVVVVTDPREVREIVTRRLGSIDRSKLMGLWFGLLAPEASIGMSSGPGFRTLRWTWNSILSPVFLGGVAGPRIMDSALGLADLWLLKGSKQQGRAFEACADLRLATLEAMVGLLLGKELGVLDSKISDIENESRGNNQQRCKQRERQALLKRLYRDFNLCLVCLDWVTQGISPIIYLWVFRNLFWPFQRAQKHVETCLQHIIDDVRQRPAGRAEAAHHPYSALELILERAALRPEAKAAMTDAALRSELIELLITGHETTASSIGWALKYLADNQGAQDRLHEELVRSLPYLGFVPTSEWIMKTHLPCLDAFIAETLRYSCTGPISFREATQDCTILGHRVPSGTPIVLMTQDVTHQEATHPGQDSTPTSTRKANTFRLLNQDTTKPPLNEFHPGRWLSDSGDFNPNAAASMAFSGGARRCYGQKIAMLEMRVFLVTLVWDFRFAKLSKGLSGYGSLDGLTRKPSCCFVLPVPRRQRPARGAETDRPRLPRLCDGYAI
jgi:cytochrome P450